jgi:hypothetical protein
MPIGLDPVGSEIVVVYVEKPLVELLSRDCVTVSLAVFAV